MSYRLVKGKYIKNYKKLFYGMKVYMQRPYRTVYVRYKNKYYQAHMMDDIRM